MKKFWLVLVMGLCGACEHPSDKAVKVVALAVPSACSVEVFCREDEAQQAKVDALLKAGKQFSGVLTPNGLNCYHTLWCK